MAKKVLGTSGDLETAIKLCREYEESTGLYARVVSQTVQGANKTYVAYGYDEECRLSRHIQGISHTGLRILAASYLASTKLRAQLEAISKNPSAPPVVHEMSREVLREKKSSLQKISDIISRHPIYHWCRIVSAGRGSLGDAAAIVFLGYIDPHEAITAGKAKKYWGFFPGGKLRSGVRSAFNPQLKGIGFFAASRVVMGRDSYYRPLFDAKKEYYASKGYMSPHNKALFWLAALLVSNAQQIIRESEGYSVPRHRMHIDPKQSADQTPDERVLEALRRGQILQ